MQNEFVYMLGVVAAGWAVTYAMRALPFLLFAGRDRALPPWVERFGNVVSPAIIAALIVYSYSGLEWRTAWPYMAGLLTVVLQISRGNPLVSIIAGTLLYMSLLAFAGCASQEPQLQYDRAHPLIRVTTSGLRFCDRPVTPKEAVSLLERHHIPKDAPIHILVEPGYDDRARSLWVFQHNYLHKAGYRKTVLVHERKATVEVAPREAGSGPAPRAGGRSPSRPPRRAFRYKGPDED